MDKKTVAIVIVVVALILVGGAYWWYQGGMVSDNQTADTSDTAAPTDDQVAGTQGQQEPASTGTTGSTGTAAKLSYTLAVKQYTDRRIQFDDTCVAYPNYVTFKKGTTIMLDNRSSKTRVISLDGVAYSIKGYDYQLVTLTTTAALPHEIMIDCGNGQNNARIYLQQ